jgi:hypothetical protein
MMLLLLMMYIFAVLGVYLFGKPLRSKLAVSHCSFFLATEHSAISSALVCL